MGGSTLSNRDLSARPNPALDFGEVIPTVGENLEVLLNRYEPVLRQIAASFRFQVRTGGGALDEDDLRQEARIYLIDLLRDFRPELNGNLEAYLRTKLRWRISNYLRSERRRRRLMDPLDLETVPHPTEEMRPRLPTGMDNPRLEAALHRLSPRQRAVIARFYWQERTVREIAREMKVTTQAVTALRRRAEMALREAMRK
jgi:RNA polymerase sigma factor (sigma-70 family)